jgi:TPR repeat protein
MSNLLEGLAAFEAKNYTQAFDWLKPLAEQGDAEAQCLIANMYHLGLGLDGDISEAIQWYQRSAEQGYGVASNNLAGIFKTGEHGDAPDSVEAKKWFQKAREQGFCHTPV